MASTGLFKVALFFASLVATMELSDARHYINRSEVFKHHPSPEQVQPEQVQPEQVQPEQVQPEQVVQQDLEISGDFASKKKSRSKRWGMGNCAAKYGDNKVHISDDFWYV